MAWWFIESNSAKDHTNWCQLPWSYSPIEITRVIKDTVCSSCKRWWCAAYSQSAAFIGSARDVDCASTHSLAGWLCCQRLLCRSSNKCHISKDVQTYHVHKSNANACTVIILSCWAAWLKQSSWSTCLTNLYSLSCQRRVRPLPHSSRCQLQLHSACEQCDRCAIATTGTARIGEVEESLQVIQVAGFQKTGTLTTV